MKIPELMEVRHVAATDKTKSHDIIVSQSNSNKVLWFPFKNSFTISCDGAVIITGERNIKTLAEIKVYDVAFTPSESVHHIVFVQSRSNV